MASYESKMQTWRKWLSLNWQQRLVFLVAFSLLPVVVGSLRVLGYRRTIRWLGVVSPSPTAHTSSQQPGLVRPRKASATEAQTATGASSGSGAQPVNASSSNKEPSSSAPTPSVSGNVELARLRQYGEATNMAANRCIVHANCLPRSIALWWILRLLRHDSQVRFGVTKQQSQLQAHAWVEFKGQPLNDEPNISQRYLPLDAAQAIQMELGA